MKKYLLAMLLTASLFTAHRGSASITVAEAEAEADATALGATASAAAITSAATTTSAAAPAPQDEVIICVWICPDTNVEYSAYGPCNVACDSACERDCFEP